MLVTVQVAVANSTARGRGSCDTVRWLGIPTVCYKVRKSAIPRYSFYVHETLTTSHIIDSFKTPHHNLNAQLSASAKGPTFGGGGT
jgi:hypothetical protein